MVEIQGVSFAYTLSDEVRLPLKGASITGCQDGYEKEQGTLSHIDLQIGQGRQEELLAGCPLYRKMWESHIGAKNWSVGKQGKEAEANV